MVYCVLLALWKVHIRKLCTSVLWEIFKILLKKIRFFQKNKKKFDVGFEPDNSKKYIKNISNVLKNNLKYVLFFILIMVKLLMRKK